MNFKELSLLWKFLKLYREVRRKMKDVKEGKKTTELAVLIGDIVVLIGGVAVGKLSIETAIIVGGVLSGVYMIGRTLCKLTKTKVDDILIEKLGQLIPKLPKKR